MSLLTTYSTRWATIYHEDGGVYHVKVFKLQKAQQSIIAPYISSPLHFSIRNSRTPAGDFVKMY